MNPQVVQNALNSLQPRQMPNSAQMKQSLIQRALELLNAKKQALMDSSVGRLAKGYLSTPQQGQPQDQAFMTGQAIANMPPATGIGAGDDLMRLAIPLIGGLTKGDDVAKILKAQGDKLVGKIDEALPIIQQSQLNKPGAMYNADDLAKVKDILIKNKETPEDLRKAQELLALHADDLAKANPPKPQGVTAGIDNLTSEANKYKSANEFYLRMNDKTRDLLRSKGVRGEEAITDFWNKNAVKTEPILDTLNPTGSLYANYDPQSRMTMKLGKNITTYDKTAKLDPDEIVTIYRGASKKHTKINPGDFITTKREVAQGYTGDGNVIEMKVKAKDILDDVTEPLGDEYIYRPQSVKPQGVTKTFIKDDLAPKDHILVKVDANKLQQVGEKYDPNFGSKLQITRLPFTDQFGNKLERAKDFISKNDNIKVPYLSIADNGQVRNIEGAHRFRALKEMGDEVVISIPKDKVEFAKQQGWFKDFYSESSVKPQGVIPKEVRGLEQKVGPMYNLAKKISARDYIKKRIPEVEKIEGNYIYTKDGNKIELAMSEFSDGLKINGIQAEKKSTGIGGKIIEALQEWTTSRYGSIRIDKAYNSSFWKKTGFTGADEYNMGWSAGDKIYRPTQAKGGVKK